MLLPWHDLHPALGPTAMILTIDYVLMCSLCASLSELLVSKLRTTATTERPVRLRTATDISVQGEARE